MNRPVITAFLVGIICAVSSPARSADPQFLSLQSTFEKTMKKIEQDYADACAARPAQYTQWLDQTMKNLQMSGDLEGVMAVKKEKERFAAQKTVPDQTSPNMPPMVVRLQADYRKAVTAGDMEKHRSVVNLVDAYTARLDALKKDLTVTGKFDDAMQAKTEADKAQRLPAYTAARFALADQEAKTQPAPAPAPANMVPCSACGGTGGVVAPCKSCSGTGQCPFCFGRGYKRSGIRGSHVRVGCISCKTTGKCRDCEGTGTIKESKCPVCDGTGRVPAPTGAPSAPANPLSTPSPAPAHEIRPKEKPVDTKDLDEYGNTLRRLRALYEKGTPDVVAFATVSRNPMAFQGRLLKSLVYLVDARARSVRVAATVEDARLSGTPLVPITAEVGTKAASLSMEIRRKDPVWIVYGVVNADNITLFEVSAGK